MKTYNGLFERMLDPEAIMLAILDSSWNKRDRPSVKTVLNDMTPMVNRIRESLLSDAWQPVIHRSTVLQEGLHRKARIIVKPRWDSEQIVHHMIVDQLKPILIPRLYAHAYGSIPQSQYPKGGVLPSTKPPRPRGTHAMKEAMVKWVKGYGDKRFYVAELDIKHFYASIDHDILKGLTRRYIRDGRFLRVCDRIIDAYDGLPLGYYTSPWLAHLYLLAMDEYILQSLKPDHYCRYADNLYLMHRNKRQLHKMVDRLRDWLSAERKLTIKENWQIFRFEDARLKEVNGKLRVTGRAIDCLGFIIHRRHVGLRKGILKRLRRRAVKAARTHRLRVMAAYAYISYMGYIWHSNTYKYYKKYVRPFLTVRACKRRIRAITLKKQTIGV